MRSLNAQQADGEVRKRILLNTSLSLKSPPNLIQELQQQKIERNSKIASQQSITAHGGSDRNIKFQLQNIEGRLKELSGELFTCRQECRQTIQNVSNLKQHLIYSELIREKQLLDGEVKGLARYCRILRNTNQERTQQIYDNCKQLWGQTADIKEFAFQLSMRVQHMESQMGLQQDYHSYKL